MEASYSKRSILSALDQPSVYDFMISSVMETKGLAQTEPKTFVMIVASSSSQEFQIFDFEDSFTDFFIIVWAWFVSNTSDMRYMVDFLTAICFRINYVC